MSTLLRLATSLGAFALLLLIWQPAPTAAPSFAVVPPAPAPVVRLGAPDQVGTPTRLSIPAIEVDEKLHPVGLKPDGAMQTPDFGDAGWYSPGPRPGAAGPAVIVAHVHRPGGPDVFWDLHRLRPGDRITVERADGSTTFVVDELEQVKKEGLPYDRIWSPSSEALLRLVTCAGDPDPRTGVYPDNTIVYAHAL